MTHQGVRAPGTGSSAASSAPAFVGRDRELASIVDALVAPPALVVVEGEPGIGKTRLLREVLASPESAEWTVLVAACPPLADPFPLGPVIDGVRRVWQQVGGVEFSPLGGALRPLFPEWAAELPPVLEPLEDPKEMRHRVLRALTELVERLNVQVLVVEDAHWADTSTLEWLLTLTSSEDPGLSIVVTYRPTDVPEGSLLPRLIAHAPGGMSQLRIVLEPLDVAQTQRLIGSMLNTDEVSQEFATFLHKHGDGVPLALEETVRLLRERHDIVRQGGTWTRRVLDDLDVPPAVRDSVLERVTRLDPDAQQVLHAAGVLAGPADESLLADVADVDERAGRRGVAAALVSGLLREVSPGRYVFRHVLDSQAVEGAIPVSERRRLHHRAATALQSRDHPSASRLARHFREAGETEAWCHNAEAAADMAWESGDDRAAVATLLDVLSAVEHPIKQRMRLARKLGEAFHFGTAPTAEFAGQVSEILRGVLASKHIDKSERGELRLLLGRVLWRDGHTRSAFEEIEAAIPDLDHRPDLAIRAMSNLSRPASSPDLPVERHMQWLNRAAELVHAAGSPVDHWHLAQARSISLLQLGEPEGWGFIDSPRKPVPEGPTERTAAVIAMNVAMATLPWGRYEVTRERLNDAITLLEATDFKRGQNAARVVIAYLDWYTGAWEGLAGAVSSLAESDDTEPQSFRLRARQLCAVLDVVAGRRSAGEPSLRHEAENAGQQLVPEPEAPFAPSMLARLLVADGAAEEALRVTGPVVEMIARKGVWLWVTDIAPVHLDALISIGRLDQAETLVRQFADGIAGIDAPAPAAALSTCRAIVAEASGAPELARLFEEAASAWAALPRPYDELLSLERQGSCLLAAGEQEQGLAVLSGAQQRLYELGARWDADRVAHVLRQHGIEVPRANRRGPRGYGDQLSPRELEVVELVARGMTNRQIGEQLFLSPKTVERHVRSASRKLGASSRIGAAMAAAEAGLLMSSSKDPAG